MNPVAPPPGGDDPSAAGPPGRAGRLLWLALLPMLVLVVLLAAWQAHAEWQRLRTDTLVEARTQASALDAVAREARHHVADLQLRAQQAMLAPAVAATPGVLAALQPRSGPAGEPDGHTLDELPEALRPGMGQWLWPPGPEAPDAAALQRAELLSALMEIAHRRHLAFASSYVVGWPERHVLVYPWVPSASLVADSGARSLAEALQPEAAQRRMQPALPEHNAAAQAWWSGPRRDASGHALVTHAAPLTVAEAVRGLVGVDLRLDRLAAVLDRLPGAPWQAWLLDEQGQVLLARDGGPAPAASAGVLRLQVTLAEAPWTLVVAAPVGALVLELLPRLLPWLLVAGTLLALGVAAQVPLFTGLRRAARGERHARQLKSAIVDHAQTAVVVVDDDDRIVEFNPAAEALFGVVRDAARGQTVRELICPPRFRGSYGRAMQRMRQGDPDRLLGQRLERMAQTADGREIPVEVVMWLTQVDGRTYFTASMADLSQARADAEVIARQREALRQSEKLSAMGGLLAGVAHELNNPLTIVTGRAALLEDKTEGTPLADDARRIREAAERCARIVRTFLNMARQRPARHAPVQLNDLVRAAAEMLGYTLRSHGITLEQRLDPALPELLADGDQIGQVVLNLLVNAQQALATHEGPRRIELSTGFDEARAWVRVSDSGPGVPEALRGSIFEPFFTTKPEGIGTGIGLAVSRSIVREHGGELQLEGDGPGAAFSLLLPRTTITP